MDDEDLRACSDALLSLWGDLESGHYQGEVDEMSSDFEGEELDNEDDFWI